MNTTIASISCLILLSTAATAQGAQAGTSTPARPATGTAAPAAPVGTSGTAAATAATDYRLVTGDKLRIEVYKDPQLSQQLQVRPDGKITLPLIGDIPAAGKTALELRDTIATSLKEYISNPVVTVIVVETIPPTVHVMGEVKAPGPQPLQGQVSVIQALAAAGGFTDWAKQTKIKILRKNPNGSTTTIQFNYKDAIQSTGKPMMLQAGDVIIVP